MTRKDILNATIDDYFVQAKSRNVSNEDAARALLLDPGFSSFCQRGVPFIGARVLDRLDKIGSGREESLVEYLYMAFLIRSFLDLTTLKPKQILPYLDCPYILSRYQYFHSQFEKKVIVHLLLRKEMNKVRRIKFSRQMKSSEEETLLYAYGILRTILPLKELDRLSIYYSDVLGRMILKSDDPHVLFYHPEEKKDTRGSMLALKENGYRIYSLVDNDPDTISELSIRIDEHSVTVFSSGEEYEIVPPGKPGRSRIE